jgi:hypothetical protein
MGARHARGQVRWISLRGDVSGDGMDLASYALVFPAEWFLCLWFDFAPAMWNFQISLGLRLLSYVREDAPHGRVMSASPSLLLMISSNMNGSKGFVLTEWNLFLCLQKALIDPITKEWCNRQLHRACHLVEWGASHCAYTFASLNRCTMEEFALISVHCFCRSGGISKCFRGDFKNWHIIPGLCKSSPVMENQFSVILPYYLVVYLLNGFGVPLPVWDMCNSCWSLNLSEDLVP